MADKRAYFKTDVGYFTNPKIAAILADSPTAVILHLGSIAYAAQHLTDGIIPALLVQRLVGATPDDAEMLRESGLWIDAGKGQVEIRDYLEHQRSAAESKKLSEAGRKAAASRWQSESDADGNADRMRNPMPREKEREKDITTAFDTFWDQYPRKIAKGNAAKAYEKALKKTDATTILNGLANYLPAWAQTEEKFIPHAATWLNGERWSDQVTPTKPVDAPPDQWARAVVVGEHR